MDATPEDRQPCSHPAPVPVHAHTGELVARLCPGCDAQLPATEPPVNWTAQFASFQ